MICLDNTDTLEGGASVDAVVDYTVHGLVANTFTVIADGQLSDTDPTVLYTAGSAISIVCITFVNTHSAAVTVNLYLDSANGGNPRRMIPKDVSLGIGYSLHFDGQRCTILDASGNVQTMPGLHAARHVAGAADPITTMVTSTNVITDNQVLRGDGGVRGAQETTIIVSDNGEMTNPSQPAFLVQKSANQEDIVAGGDVTITWDTERFDQNNDFAANTFTAPVDGKYALSMKITFNQIDTVSTQIRIRIVTSNRTFFFFIFPNLLFSADSGFDLPFSIICDMDAADMVYVDMNQTGGANQADVSLYSWFSGALIC